MFGLPCCYLFGNYQLDIYRKHAARGQHPGRFLAEHFYRFDQLDFATQDLPAILGEIAEELHLESTLAMDWDSEIIGEASIHLVIELVHSLRIAMRIATVCMITSYLLVV